MAAGCIKTLLDIAGGLFLVLSGIFLLFLYLCLRTSLDNWFVSFSAILILVGLGLGGFVLGIRRIFLALHHKRKET